MSSKDKVSIARRIGEHLSIREYRSSDFDSLVARVQQYYLEDLEVEFKREQLITTINEFDNNPLRGRIEIVEREGESIGYAILVPYWSNEFGGVMLQLDELFIDASERGRGAGSLYIRDLISNPPYSAVAIMLEVTQKNERARSLYEKIGFATHRHTHMLYEL